MGREAAMRMNTVDGARYLGLDIGSTTVKLALVDGEGHYIEKPVCVRSMGRPFEAVENVLHDMAGRYDGRVSVGITGSGREAVRRVLGLGSESAVTEIYAHACGGRHVCPGVRSIVDIGGQDSKVIRISGDAKGAFRIEDFRMNDLCAAGTGSFLEMHAGELGYESVEAFGRAAAASKHACRIAGRCSVLAQSDIVHLRQKGDDVTDIAAGLCRAVVLNVLGMTGGLPLLAPVLFQGGVAANRGVVNALRRELGFENGELLVPEHHQAIGALGAALHARGNGCETRRLTELVEALHAVRARNTGSRKAALSADGSVTENKQRLVADCDAPVAHTIQPVSVVEQAAGRSCCVDYGIALGFDVGSASVKIAAVDMNNTCVFTHYELHEGRPMDSVHRGLDALQRTLGEVVPRAVAVTGSGRDMVELRMGADLNVDEITAQGAGALALEPEAQAIFEIGGQDSKFIRLDNGRVVDFEMNRICAAGTGAFVVEGAKVMGVAPGAELDALALESRAPAALSSRCSVFTKSDIVSRLNSGEAREDIAAGLMLAVARNYLTLVVGNRDVGQSVIFLGGLARNSRAVAAAMKALRPDLEIVAPAGCEVSGALGAATLAVKEVKAGHVVASKFRGVSVAHMNQPIKEFVCRACPNECDIREWRTGPDETSLTGGICGRYEDRNGGAKHGRNFVGEYLDLLKTYEEPPDPEKERGGAGVIGIPRALLYYEQGPVWIGFLRAMGFDVVLSRSDRDVLTLGSRYSPSAEICLPVKALVGHVAQLRAAGVRRIFFPTVVESRHLPGAGRSDSCMLIQGAMDGFLKPAFPELDFINPVFAYEGRKYQWREALLETGLKLGIGRAQVKRAVARAEQVSADLARRRGELGKAFMKAVEQGESSTVLMGRPYSFAPELDMGIPRHLARLGANVAPMTILPALEEESLTNNHFDLVFKSSQDLVLGAQFIQRQKRNLFPVILNQFLCRQDCAVIPFVSQMLRDRPCLQLALDENAGDVGFRTRCSAFRRVMDHHLQDHGKTPLMSTASPFKSFVPDGRYRREKGTVWISPAVRFFSAAFQAIGMRTKLLEAGSPELIERGRKYFPNGEPCVPFIQLAGALEKLKDNPEFDPKNHYLHIPGTRHCASTTLPHLIRGICEKLGLGEVRILSPREGFDITEGGDIFGIAFSQNLVRGLLGDEYLNKLMLSIRPYEIRAGETDRVFNECIEEFYSSFRHPEDYFDTLERLVARLAAVPAVKKGTRPRILVTGEYVVRTDSSLNQDIRRKIETAGGEALRTPLFADYVEVIAHLRYRALWKQRKYGRMLRDFFLSRFCLRDISRIRRLFAPLIPSQIEPGPVEYIKLFGNYMCDKLDPGILLEFYQTLWNMEREKVAGIVNVHPFGCSISSAVEPMLTRFFGKQVSILKLSFDGQGQVHHDNRLAAFMECVHAGFQGDRPDVPDRHFMPQAAFSGLLSPEPGEPAIVRERAAAV
ncbi:MAG: hypothetical protein C0404_02345 [Verrucomicrobia bacterium]|nr:hypothetical protein [Verrucomicrobiota bacterium]